MNNTIEHPEEESLLRYLDRDPLVDLTGHLLECQQCRQCLDGLVVLREMALKPKQIVDTSSSVSALLDEDLISTKRNQLIDEIKSVPANLKSTLFALSQESSRQTDSQELQEMSGQKDLNRDKSRNGYIGSILAIFDELFDQWSWHWVPITGLTALLVAVVWIGPDRTEISQYQDIAGLRILDQKASTPGIGFFSGSQIQKMDYPDVTVNFNTHNQLVISWSEIVQAKIYRLKLQMHIDGISKTMVNIETEETSTLVELPRTNYNRRYEWTLSGETMDNKGFIASGGFVIHE